MSNAIKNQEISLPRKSQKGLAPNGPVGIHKTYARVESRQVSVAHRISQHRYESDNEKQPCTDGIFKFRTITPPKLASSPFAANIGGDELDEHHEENSELIAIKTNVLPEIGNECKYIGIFVSLILSFCLNLSINIFSNKFPNN